MERSCLGALLVIICATTGCGDSPRPMADMRDSAAVAPPPPPKPKVWEPRPVVAPPDTTRPDTLTADTTAAGDSLADTASVKRDNVPPRTRARGPRPFILS
ncbi:MAG: hypothetical protein M3Q37_10165, partial [Gemmatimonadota bacterium]|nr:hypothetical protein [Gemmatimonadota bacterium]